MVRFRTPGSGRMTWSVVSVAGGRQSVYRRSGLVQSAFWMYDARNDDRVRPSHAAMGGVIFRHDDPIWATHYPAQRLELPVWRAGVDVGAGPGEGCASGTATVRSRRPTGGWARQADRRGHHQTGKGVPVPGPRRRHTHDDTRRRVGSAPRGLL